MGADAIQPRAISRLSDNSISALAKILTAVEKQGDWPDALKLVLTVLIPKSDGGLRPIGLFPTIVRLWMRFRRPTTKQWRNDNKREYRYGGAGRGEQRAAYIHSARAELAHDSGRSYAAILLDLVQAFEMIPHHHIAAAAKKHGYNLWVLRMSLRAYIIPGTIVVDGVSMFRAQNGGTRNHSGIWIRH